MEVSFFIFQILKSWWWLFFSLISFFTARFFYLYWIRWEVFYKEAFKWILLEIKPPKEVLKPFSAMENVFSVLFGLIDIPNWRERWCGGELPLGGGGWFSFEICSFGGEIHFFARIPDFFRNTFETAIYSQYPDAEITEAEDYTQRVPKDIPNEKWDLYSENYVLFQKDYYPIKTYSMFFEKPEEEKRVIEEKRLDPMDSLLEVLAKLQSGEQVWIQINCNPIFPVHPRHKIYFPILEKGRAEADRIAKRPQVKKKSLLEEMIGILIGGKPAEEKPKELELIAPELRLTPVEKEILTGIENKLKKPLYQCWIRQVYICKKDEPYFFDNYKMVRGYFLGQFQTTHLNQFSYHGPTRTRIHYWLKARRLYLRKRQRFRDYIERFPSYFFGDLRGEPSFFLKLLGITDNSTCILNIEELATIFHFPVKIYIPTVPRVEAKRVGPPPTLPGE
jgi:hypothetical protein